MRRAFLLVSVLITGLLPGGPGPANATTTTLQPCGGAVSERCIVSVTRAGTPVPLPAGPGDPYEVIATEFTDGSRTEFFFTVLRGDEDPHSLDPSEEWKVVLNTGSMPPDETFSRGADVTVERSSGAPYQVGFTMKPVEMALTTDGCGGNGDCGDSTSVAAELRSGVIEAWIGDVGYVTDPDERAARKGFDFSTNADWSSSPPQLDWATNSIVIDVANAHFKPGGTVPFIGSAEFHLPFPMLERLYQVDDPATLTAGAFQVSGGGGSAAVSVTVNAGDSVDVRFSGITFSKRKLRIRGNTRPLAPKKVRAVRRTVKRGAIGFQSAQPRGSKVRRYVAVCKRNKHKVRGAGKGSPVVVKPLKAGAYECTVRARSRAGLGRAAKVRMPRS